LNSKEVVFLILLSTVLGVTGGILATCYFYNKFMFKQFGAMTDSLVKTNDRVARWIPVDVVQEVVPQEELKKLRRGK